MTALWLWILLSFPGFGTPSSLAEVGLSQWQPQYTFYAAYSSSLGSLVGSRFTWRQPEKGLGFSLSLIRTDHATYGGFDLLLERTFLGGTWGLQIHYLRPLGSSWNTAGSRFLQGP